MLADIPRSHPSSGACFLCFILGWAGEKCNGLFICHRSSQWFVLRGRLQSGCGASAFFLLPGLQTVLKRGGHGERGDDASVLRRTERGFTTIRKPVQGKGVDMKEAGFMYTFAHTHQNSSHLGLESKAACKLSRHHTGSGRRDDPQERGGKATSFSETDECTYSLLFSIRMCSLEQLGCVRFCAQRLTLTWTFLCKSPPAPFLKDGSRSKSWRKRDWFSSSDLSWGVCDSTLQ